MIRLISLMAFLTLLGVAAIAAPNWSKLRLDIEPGVGTADLRLNEVTPKEWPNALGKPDIDFRYADSGEGFRHLYWGETHKGKLTKGIEIETQGATPTSEIIIDILVRGVRATVSTEKLFIGLPADRISERSRTVQKDDVKTYLLPGLTLEIQEGKLFGLRVKSEASTRWRFSNWTIEAGKGVGPIRLGAEFGDALQQTLGKPDHLSPTGATWTSSNGAQLLEIEIEPRNRAIKRISGVGLPWRTSEGLTINDSLDSFLSKHLGAKSDFGRASDQMIAKLPGLRVNFTGRRLQGFAIFPLSN